MRVNVLKNEEKGSKLLKEFKNGKVNKSDAIRGLFELGYDVKEISSMLGIIYNMCYNIISKYVLRNNMEDKIVKEVKISFESELIEYVKNNKEVKKSEVVKYFIKRGRGEGYIYSNLKKLIEEGKVSFK